MTQDKILCDIGFIGLGVMGKNLVLNLADNGFNIAAFDLSDEKVQAVIAQDEAENTTGTQRVYGCSSYTELLSQLKAPHLIVLSVPAGAPVDQVCENLIGAGIRGNGNRTSPIDSSNRGERVAQFQLCHSRKRHRCTARSADQHVF